MPHTHIICTLGPATQTEEMIRKLVEAGMGIARVNCSHGTMEAHRATVRLLHGISASLPTPFASMLDTRGCEIRTGDMSSPLRVTHGQKVRFSHIPAEEKEGIVTIMVNYDDFPKDVKGASIILLDNGDMIFDIVEILPDGSVIAQSRDDGTIGSRRHINLPGASISLPSMAADDWRDLDMGIEENVDMVALSFIRTAEDVLEVKRHLQRKQSPMLIIAKIETQQSIDNIDAIIAASDCIMVARGDLGAELPFERIPALQDMIVQKCIDAGKPVIVATQMLESMITHPRPTRAEVTDVAHAAVTRADMTMLSGETAMGKYPIACVQAMATILRETERTQPAMMRTHLCCPFGERSALADSAVSMALSTNARAILVCTGSGLTARAVSQMRSNIPIIAITESKAVARQLCLSHGISPTLTPSCANPEEEVQAAMKTALATGKVKEGDKVVIIADTVGKEGNIRSVQIRTIS